VGLKSFFINVLLSLFLFFFFFRQEIWKISRDFGADCEYELSDKTSHLISNRIDTEKALESQERGIPAVKPDWIYECCRKWERLEWDSFKLMITGTIRRNKRSATELEESEFEEDEQIKEISTLEPILDEAELEEIEKELLDLEGDSEEGEGGEGDESERFSSDSNSYSKSRNISGITRNISTSNTIEDNYYSGAELSDGDFSDLLNYSSSSANDDDDN